MHMSAHTANELVFILLSSCRLEQARNATFAVLSFQQVSIDRNLMDASCWRMSVPFVAASLANDIAFFIVFYYVAGLGSTFWCGAGDDDFVAARALRNLRGNLLCGDVEWIRCYVDRICSRPFRLIWLSDVLSGIFLHQGGVTAYSISSWITSCCAFFLALTLLNGLF